MLRKRTFIIALCCVLSLAVLFSGCGNSGDSETPEDKASTSGSTDGKDTDTNQEEDKEQYDPFGKYDPPITVSAARVLTSWMKFDEGDSLENNFWTRTFEEQLGIKIDWKWTAPNWGEPLEQKVYTSMATNDLPDFMCVYGSIYKKLLNAGKLADLSDAYQKYASPMLWETMEADNNRILKGGTVDGKLHAIGLPSGFNTNIGAIYVRKDWLDNLGLSEPRTFDELEVVAKAFAAQDPDGNGKDDTYGIVADKDLATLNFFFDSFHAYDDWVIRDGKLEFGRIQPETKAALQKLAEWYKEGILSKEFAIKDVNNETRQDIVAGKVGIRYTWMEGLTAPEFLDQHKNEPDSDWIAIPLLSPDDKPALSWNRSRVQDFNVVSDTAKHPEAAIKMMNLMLQCYSLDNKPEFVKSYDYHITQQGSLSFFMSPFRMLPSDLDPKAAAVALDYLKNQKDPSDLPFESRDIYEKLKKYEETKDPELWGWWKTFREGGDMQYKMELAEQGLRYISPVTWVETDADAEYGPDLNSRFKEFAIKGIMEDDVDNQFEAWVEYFWANGGREMTEQNNAMYQQSK